MAKAKTPPTNKKHKLLMNKKLNRPYELDEQNKPFERKVVFLRYTRLKQDRYRPKEERQRLARAAMKAAERERRKREIMRKIFLKRREKEYGKPDIEINTVPKRSPKKKLEVISCIESDMKPKRIRFTPNARFEVHTDEEEEEEEQEDRDDDDSDGSDDEEEEGNEHVAGEAAEAEPEALDIVPTESVPSAAQSEAELARATRSGRAGRYVPPDTKNETAASKSTGDKHDYVCGVCLFAESHDDVDSMLLCDGACLRPFHLACVKLDALPEGDWQCKDCIAKRHTCFVCKEYEDDSDLTQCIANNCGKYYHEKCLEGLPHLVRTEKGIKCPAHVCHVCADPTSKDCKLLCVYCPKSYHITCLPPDATVVVIPRIICERHPEIFKPALDRCEIQDDPSWTAEDKLRARLEKVREMIVFKRTYHYRLPREIFDFSQRMHDAPAEFAKIRTNIWMCAKPPAEDKENVSQCHCTTNCGEDEMCQNRLLLVECTKANCNLDPKICTNRRIQKRNWSATQVFKTNQTGWGLKAVAPIKKNQFVIEYCGEVLDDELCGQRFLELKETYETNWYMMEVSADLVIDASKKGNNARFVNHSCDPNCYAEKWTVGNETHIALFAAKDIEQGAELTYNYQFTHFCPQKFLCRCGAANCGGVFGAKPKKNAAETFKDLMKELNRTSKKRDWSLREIQNWPLSAKETDEELRDRAHALVSTRAYVDPTCFIRAVQSTKECNFVRERRLFLLRGYTLSRQRYAKSFYKSKAFKIRARALTEIDKTLFSDDACHKCRGVGELICCDRCNAPYHLSCADLKAVPMGDWHCAECSKDVKSAARRRHAARDASTKKPILTESTVSSQLDSAAPLSRNHSTVTDVSMTEVEEDSRLGTDPSSQQRSVLVFNEASRDFLDNHVNGEMSQMSAVGVQWADSSRDGFPSDSNLPPPHIEHVNGNGNGPRALKASSSSSSSTSTDNKQRRKDKDSNGEIAEGAATGDEELNGTASSDSNNKKGKGKRKAPVNFAQAFGTTNTTNSNTANAATNGANTTTRTLTRTRSRTNKQDEHALKTEEEESGEPQESRSRAASTVEEESEFSPHTQATYFVEPTVNRSVLRLQHRMIGKLSEDQLEHRAKRLHEIVDNILKWDERVQKLRKEAATKKAQTAPNTPAKSPTNNKGRTPESGGLRSTQSTPGGRGGRGRKKTNLKRSPKASSTSSSAAAGAVAGVAGKGKDSKESKSSNSDDKDISKKLFGRTLSRTVTAESNCNGGVHVESIAEADEGLEEQTPMDVTETANGTVAVGENDAIVLPASTMTFSAGVSSSSSASLVPFAPELPVSNDSTAVILPLESGRGSPVNSPTAMGTHLKEGEIIMPKFFLITHMGRWIYGYIDTAAMLPKQLAKRSATREMLSESPMIDSEERLRLRMEALKDDEIQYWLCREVTTRRYVWHGPASVVGAIRVVKSHLAETIGKYSQKKSVMGEVETEKTVRSAYAACQLYQNLWSVPNSNTINRYSTLLSRAWLSDTMISFRKSRAPVQYAVLAKQLYKYESLDSKDPKLRSIYDIPVKKPKAVVHVHNTNNNNNNGIASSSSASTSNNKNKKRKTSSAAANVPSTVPQKKSKNTAQVEPQVEQAEEVSATAASTETSGAIRRSNRERKVTRRDDAYYEDDDEDLLLAKKQSKLDTTPAKHDSSQMNGKSKTSNKTANKTANKAKSKGKPNGKGKTSVKVNVKAVKQQPKKRKRKTSSSSEDDSSVNADSDEEEEEALLMAQDMAEIEAMSEVEEPAAGTNKRSQRVKKPRVGASTKVIKMIRQKEDGGEEEEEVKQ
eukprot:GILK01005216.1.p1 GENE.GILK01005216.1~~GILK01005216.1.p1  ORF type:complete len:1826 (+),score=402.53 GILK01005216.1:51-5480(+)